MTNKLLKYQHDLDVYSNSMDARSKSREMGFEGAIHVYDLDGQAYYMPGPSHEAYLDSKLPDEEFEPEDITEDRMEEALRVVVETVMGKSEETLDDLQVLKIDDEHRILYGWASVTTYKGEAIVDRQGDIIETDTLVDAVNKFMEGVRVGKLMHQGEQVGQILHSFPVTKEICGALGIQTDKEGWITGYKIFDDDLWKDVKSGKYAAFSIGGRGVKEEINA